MTEMMRSKHQELGLTDDEFELVKLFTAQVSIALKNAEIHRAVEIRARTDDLTGLLNHGTFQAEYSLWGTLGLIIAASILMHGVLVTPALKRLHHRYRALGIPGHADA